jgi:methionyl-tRNA formyltransferase
MKDEKFFILHFSFFICPMRIICMGTPEFAIPTFEKLIEEGHDIAAIVTAPDKPAGRGKKLRPSPVKQWAEAKGFEILQPRRLRSKKFLARLRELEVELAVVVAFRMLPEAVWSVPSIGTINLHAALLPDYRGAAPINWVLINGEKRSGVTTFFIDHKIDTGEMLLQEALEVPEDWTAGDLHDALMKLGGDVVAKTVAALEAGSLKTTPQDHTKFQNPAPKIFKEDCEIDWNQPTETIYNFVRGLSPYPAAFTWLDGRMLKVLKAEKREEAAFGDPGEVSKEKNALLVSTSDGMLAITELQLQGKRRMPAGDFLRGYNGACKIGKND